MASAFSRETVTPCAGAGKVDLPDPAALAIYAWQSLDETLFKTAIRIQARAVQRAVNGNRHTMIQCIRVKCVWAGRSAISSAAAVGAS
jgi:hypothetical protein